MYLKQLDLFGFKSFAERTKLVFSPGLSAIMGPNGCGKSNISDAIRWVLGEQSARNLRGRRMEDIIFNGTDHKRPLGFAEISLTLDNCQGSLPLDYSEVTITRKLFRSGESEFAINKIPCRLKDIQDLFLDTGLGRSPYALIGQGQLDSILSANPKERRVLLDEAAGINKYKLKRQQTQTKLDQTNEDLIHIEALLAQLREGLEPLKERAQRAGRALELQERLGEHRRQYASWCYQESQRRFLDALEKEREAQRQLAAAERDLAQAQEVLAQQQAQMAEVSQQLQELRENFSREREEIGRWQNQIQLLEEKLALLETQEADLERQKAQRQQRLTQLQDQLEDQREGLQGAVEEVLAAQRRVEEERAKGEGIRGQWMAARTRLENKRTDLLDTLQRETQLNNSLSHLQGERERIARQLREVTAEIGEKEREAEAVQGTLEKGESRLQDLKVQGANLGDRIKGLLETREELLLREEQIQGQLAHIQRQLQDLQGRRRTLEELEASYHGYFQGSKYVLQNRGKWPGLLGAVVEVIDVPQHYQRAISTALGSALQNLITADQRTAQQIIEELKKRRAGRATFLPLDALRASRVSDRDQKYLKEPGVVGIAADLIEYEDRFRPAIDYLLGRCIITVDLTAATGLARHLRGFQRIITLDGDYITPGGAITGGSQTSQGESPLLLRKGALQEVEAALGKLKGASDDKQRQLLDCRKQREQVAQEIAGLEKAQHDLALEEAALAKDVENQRRTLGRLKGEIEAAEAWQGELTRHLAEMASRLEELTSQGERTKNQRLKLEEEISSLGRQVQDLEANSQTGEAHWREAEIALAEAKGMQERLEGQVKETMAALAVLEKELEGDAAAGKEHQKRRLELAAALQEAKDQLVHHREGQARWAAQIEAREASLAVAKEREGESHRVVATLTEEVNSLGKAYNNCRLARERQGWQREAELAKLQELGMDEGNLPKPQRPPQELAAEIRKLEEELALLGPTDPQTIQEAEELEEKCRFLSKQVADLKEAREKLLRLIGAIDRDSKRRFLETFTQVQKHFRALFRQLFDGGTAELILVDPEMPLESGIEIVARPPGKKNQSLALLSGGERALTAIALIFAIIKERPSPFCLLDEIDAALDEANLDKYVAVLKEFVHLLQIIVITHRPRVMEAADNLLGVTIDPRGVSQLISLRLADKVG
ncbi:MAG: chromosome segregation protein SMC [Limnochordia bacterium]|jgi:chromosome segregation protein